MSPLRRILIFVSLCLVPSLAAADPQTLLVLNSQPGDYIGGGIRQVFTDADGTFNVSGSPTSGAHITFQTPGFTSWWYLDFVGPTDQPFTKSVYDDAHRYPFNGQAQPGLSVSGDGRGCNTLTGRFLVSDLTFNQDGTVATLAVDFEQHCEGAPPALYGSIRFNSAVSMVPRVSVANTKALKGNTGTSDADMILSLSMPSDAPISVDYHTADGTAIEGTDYVGTTGTATFEPGVTSQTISVPIIGDRSARGNTSFHVVLGSPNGAPLGDRTNSIRIYDPNVPMNALAFYSQQGDYIGAGQLALYTTADAIFTTSRNVSVSILGVDWWYLDFAGPDNQTLTPGLYLNAQRYPFEPPGVPGLSFAGNGRGCNTLTGRFVVLDAVYAPNGDVRRFGADFEQHCEGGKPALFGSIRIHSNLRQLSVSNAVINGSTAEFSVTLNPASQNTVSVNFSTADGTGIAGVDYLATSQTVTFSPGETAQTVSVPLLTQTGTKDFFGQLSAPKWAPVWIKQATARF